jgi:hypothetical protein
MEVDLMMQSSFIGKVEKARLYAQEKDRVCFSTFSACFKGDNDSHSVTYDRGKWSCTCHSFMHAGLCSHTMAMQKMLDGMVIPEQPVVVV